MVRKEFHYELFYHEELRDKMRSYEKQLIKIFHNLIETGKIK